MKASSITRGQRAALLAGAFGALTGLSATPALAQGVTAYGVVDLFVGSVKVGSTTRKEMSDGGQAASRFGVRGTEDLGGGMSAEFTAESSIFADTGASNAAAFWDRQVFVGVSGSMGRLRLGRQYSPHFIALASADPFGANSVFSPLLPMFGRDGQTNLVPFPVRLNNMIGYTSPRIAGAFTAEFAYAPGESATPSKASGEGMSMALSYRAGNAFVVLGASQMRGGSATAPVARPSKNDFVSLGGSYKFGSLTVYGNWMDTTSNDVATLDAQHLNVGLNYAMGATSLLAGYTKRDVKQSTRDADLLTLGVDHALSKRTSLYGRYIALTNKGNAANGVARGLVAANSGEDVRGFAAGVRHNF